MIKLRDYQIKAHQEIEEAFRKRLRPLLLMSTGSGKSKTLMSFIEKHQKHFNFVVIVKTRKLVDQLGEDAKLFNLDYGVFMASHDDFDPSKGVQVCSVDTIKARGQFPLANSERDLILIIDEADESMSSTYTSIIERYLDRAKIYGHNGRTFFMGDTATAFDKALTHFNTVIEPIKPLELLRRGFLVDFKYKLPKVRVNYDDVKIEKGTWSTKDVNLKLNTPHMIKECFNAWLEYGENRQTLVFCINKDHAKNFVAYVNDYYQKTMAGFIYDRTPKKEREKLYKDFNNGFLRFLVNVRIITRGVDIPIIGTILDLAPTLKVNLHRQKIGRGSRPNPFYKDCIIIDPCKNNENNGHFYMDLEPLLKEDRKRSRSVLNSPMTIICEKCFKPFEPQSKCPYCGALADKIKPPKLSKAKKEKIFLETATPEQIEQRKIIKDFKKILWQFENMGRKLPRQAARKKAIIKIIKKYSLDRVLKVQKSIGLTQEIIDEYKNLYEYTPLGGLDL